MRSAQTPIRSTFLVIAAVAMLASTGFAPGAAAHSVSTDLEAQVSERLINDALDAIGEIRVTGRWKYKKKKRYLFGLISVKFKARVDFEVGARDMVIDLQPDRFILDAEVFLKARAKGKVTVIGIGIGAKFKFSYTAPWHVDMNVGWDPARVALMLDVNELRIPLYIKFRGKRYNLTSFNIARFLPKVDFALPIALVRDVTVPIPAFSPKNKIAGGRLSTAGFTRVMEVSVISPDLEILDGAIRVTADMGIAPK